VNVNVSGLNTSVLHATKRGKVGVDDVTLEKNFGIILEVAKRTRAVTTQRGLI
jgi:hypothetical protein